MSNNLAKYEVLIEQYFAFNTRHKWCVQGFSGSSVVIQTSRQNLMCSSTWRSIWGHHSFERIFCSHFVISAWSSWAKVIALCLSLVGSTMRFPWSRMFWSVMQSSSDTCLYCEGSLRGLFFWRLSLTCVSSSSSVDACWLSSIVMVPDVSCSAN